MEKIEQKDGSDVRVYDVAPTHILITSELNGNYNEVPIEKSSIPKLIDALKKFV